MTKRVICVWVGTCKSENELYDNYLAYKYDNIDEPESQFCKDTELNHYDEDFIESWWFEQLTINTLLEYSLGLLEYKYFYNDLIKKLKQLNLSNKNFITFLYGEKGNYSANESLFSYDGIKKSSDKSIEFVFKKEYELK